MKKLKIFISSPSDVIHERLTAQKVITRLNREFKNHLDIEGVFWEREPLVVTSTYQELITLPSETDIVIVILWSRLGTDLDPKKFKGKVTGKVPITGTEWEFEEAYKHFQINNTPNILLYKKTSEDKPTTRNISIVNEFARQEELIKSFFEHWVIDKEDNTFKAAYHTFETSDIFEEILEEHLRKELIKQLNSSIMKQVNWYKGNPFRGLQSFEIEHNQIFFGRNKTIHRLRESLLKQIKNNTAFLLVIGASGSGKSSLVKAGLLSDLLLPGMIDNVALVRYTILKPSDNENSLIMGLARAIVQNNALPELENLEYTEDELSNHFKKAPLRASHPIKQALSEITKKEQLTEVSKTKFIIIIDQLEEIFTLKNIDNKQRIEYINLLSILARSGYVWIISTMRSDFYHNLEQYPELINLTEKHGQYQLSFPSEAEIGQIINKPAKESGLIFEVNEYGISLEEELRQNASKDTSSLPLLEYMLEQLWQKRTADGILTYKAYKELGGIKGAIGQKAEEVFNTLPKKVQNTLPSLLRMLVSISDEGKNKKTSRKIPFHMFEKDEDMLILVNKMLSSEVRLLVSDKDENSNKKYIRVSHEALFENWKRAKEKINEYQSAIQLRDRLEVTASLWKKEKVNRQSLLLQEGLPLSQGENLLNNFGNEIENNIKVFVKASITNNNKIKQRKKNFYIILVIVSLLVSIAMVFLTIRAKEQILITKQQKEQLIEEKNRALELEQKAIFKSIQSTIYNNKTRDYINRSLIKISQKGKKNLNEYVTQLLDNGLKDVLIQIIISNYDKTLLDNNQIKTMFYQIPNSQFILFIENTLSNIKNKDLKNIKKEPSKQSFNKDIIKKSCFTHNNANSCLQLGDEDALIHYMSFSKNPNLKSYIKLFKIKERKNKHQEAQHLIKKVEIIYLNKLKRYYENYLTIPKDKVYYQVTIKKEKLLLNDLQSAINKISPKYIFYTKTEFLEKIKFLYQKEILENEKLIILKKYKIKAKDYHMNMIAESLRDLYYIQDYLTGKILINEEYLNIAYKVKNNNIILYLDLLHNLKHLYSKLDNFINHKYDDKKIEINLKILRVYANNINIKLTDRHRKFIANIYGSLSWYYLFNGNYKKALNSSKRGILLDSSKLYIYTNLAHAHLLLGNIKLAKDIYYRYIGNIIKSNNKLFEDVIKKDFEELKINNISSPHFKKIILEINEKKKEDFAGIGCYLNKIHGKGININSIFKNSPAEKANLKVNDIILKIDQKEVNNIPIDNSILLLKGIEGTSVNLTIFRESTHKIFEVNLIREKIIVPEKINKKYFLLNNFSSIGLRNNEKKAFEKQLSLSLSLNKKEKLKVIGALHRLSKEQYIGLVNVFKDEQKKMKELGEEYPNDLKKLKKRAHDEWKDIKNEITTLFKTNELLNMKKEYKEHMVK